MKLPDAIKWRADNLLSLFLHRLRYRIIWQTNETLRITSSYYVGETTRHFSTRVREHLVSDRASHIFKHLQNSEHCRALCSVDCFHSLDHASTTFQL